MIDTSKIPASRLLKESFDAIPQSGSSNVITSGAVFNALEEKLGKTDTAIKAQADADGNIINQTYVMYEYEE